tara:strand:- start:246 stop:1424 length:1179 start_codon:yes stop_codon:yes gene_type:complete
MNKYIQGKKDELIKPKILLVANSSWYIYNFRLPLIKALKDKGYEVVIVSPEDKYTNILQKNNFKTRKWILSRVSLNPILEMNSIIDLIKIYSKEKPKLVHHFTIKACLYGTIAAKLAGIYFVINAITGLGHVFLGNRKRNILLRRLLKPIYRGVFMARRSTVVFQNADDQERLIELGITDDSRSRLIRGSGVDINYFQPKKNFVGTFSNPLQILFPSRLIKEKGIEELLQACEGLWKEGIDIELLIAGAEDDGNRSSLNKEDIDVLSREKRIKCLGHIDDMKSLYSSCDIVVLPSWREGLSRALIEAAAMEIPIITTDVPGCRDVVDHGKSGLLVPLKNHKAIALAIKLLIENPKLARKFGQEAREKVVNEFQVSLVNKSTLDQYEFLLKAN